MNLDTLIAKYIKKLIWLSKHHKDDFNDSDEDSEEYFGQEEFSYGDL